MNLLLLLGCARQVTWQVQPLASYALPSLEVSVVAADRGCKKVADELASTLSARPGVVVRPDASVRLQLQSCEAQVDTVVEMESTYPGLVYDTRVVHERRRYDMRAWATAEMVVQSPDAASAHLTGGAERREDGPWVSEGTLELPRAMSLEESVRRDLAHDLADQIAPLPATIRRTLYRDPEPGTARQLHNAAVDAERAGKLDEALRLAEQAYAANPTAAEMRYMQALQDHARAVGYALLPADQRK